MATIGMEVKRILRAYRDDVIDEDTAVHRLGEKFNQLGQNQALSLQQESIRLGKIGTELQAEQNVIFKQMLKHLRGEED
jgi:hypothetical protein